TLKVHYAKADFHRDGELFPTMGLKGITDRSAVRRGTISERVAIAAQLDREADGPVNMSCGLNDESTGLAHASADARIVEIRGSTALAEKETKLLSFVGGASRILLTKSAIAGFGMNFQHAHIAIFVGLNDSWETWFQTIRRLWRYGQTHEVTVHL